MMNTSNSDYNEGWNDCYHETLDDLIEEMNLIKDESLIKGLAHAILVIRGSEPKLYKGKWILN